MNKKLIAAAVSAAVMAPVAASAQDEGPSITVYGRVNQAIRLRDIDDGTSDSTVDVADVASRFGLKGSADVGNGMTASGKLEFSTNSDNQTGPKDVRIGMVGLSGSFGSVTVGNQYSSYNTLVGTYFDPTYTLGYFIYSQVGAPYRTSNTIKYANTFGPVSLGVDLRLNDSNDASAEQTAASLGGEQGFGIAASFAATERLTLAAGWDQSSAFAAQEAAGADDQEILGVAGMWSAENFWLSLGWQERDGGITGSGTTYENMTAGIGTSFGEKTTAGLWYQAGKSEGISTTGVDNLAQPEAIVINIAHVLGGGMRLYYEGLFYDADNESGTGGSAGGHVGTGTTFDFDTDTHLFGMRIDF